MEPPDYLDAVVDEVTDIVGGQKLLFYLLKRCRCVDGSSRFILAVHLSFM